jgi:hypothetical protein
MVAQSDDPVVRQPSADIRQNTSCASRNQGYNAGRKPMPARYVIDRQDRTVRTVFSGVLTRNDVAEHAKKLRNDPDFDPAFSELVDLTEASEVKLGHEDFRMLALVDPFGPKSKRAFVVLSASIYGVTRMFQLMRDGSANVAIFKTKEEAATWLREPG